MAFWIGLRKRALLDKQGNDRWHSWRCGKQSYFLNSMITCNKDLNAKVNSVELTVSAGY